ncbi:hypothetical protein C8R48DRAFT_623395, partial [Suillus tomentosus]
RNLLVLLASYQLVESVLGSITLPHCTQTVASLRHCHAAGLIFAIATLAQNTVPKEIRLSVNVERRALELFALPIVLS